MSMSYSRSASPSDSVSSTATTPARTIASILNHVPAPPTQSTTVKLHKTHHRVVATKYATSTDSRGHIPVYEYDLPSGHTIMIDSETSMVHFTGIWKALGHSKADVVRLIESQPEVAPSIRKVRGGYLKIQGTWLPYEIAQSLAKRVAWDLRHDLVPLFGPDFPDECLAPGDPGFGQLLLSSPSKRRPARSVDARAEARAEAQAAAALALNNKSVVTADQANMAKPILAKLKKVEPVLGELSAGNSAGGAGGGRKRSPLNLEAAKAARRYSGNPYETGFYQTSIPVGHYSGGTALRRTASAGATSYSPYPIPPVPFSGSSNGRYSPYGLYVPSYYSPSIHSTSSYPRQAPRHPTAALNDDATPQTADRYLSPHYPQQPIRSVSQPPTPTTSNYTAYSSPFTSIGEKLSAVRDETNPRSYGAHSARQFVEMQPPSLTHSPTDSGFSSTSSSWISDAPSPLTAVAPIAVPQEQQQPYLASDFFERQQYQQATLYSAYESETYRLPSPVPPATLAAAKGPETPTTEQTAMDFTNGQPRRYSPPSYRLALAQGYQSVQVPQNQNGSQQHQPPLLQPSPQYSQATQRSPLLDSPPVQSSLELVAQQHEIRVQQ